MHLIALARHEQGLNEVETEGQGQDLPESLQSSLPQSYLSPILPMP